MSVSHNFPTLCKFVIMSKLCKKKHTTTKKKSVGIKYNLLIKLKSLKIDIYFFQVEKSVPHVIKEGKNIFFINRKTDFNIKNA